MARVADPIRLGSRAVEVTRGGDGTLLLRSPQPLGPYPLRLTERLVQFARAAPDRTLLAQRGADGAWIRVSYAEAYRRVRGIAQSLLARPLSPERPIAILSENGIDHQLLALAAQHCGIPYAPVSTAYSLISADFSKLRHVLGLLTPGLVFAADGARYGKAIEATVDAQTEVVLACGALTHRRSTRFDELEAARPGVDVDAAFERIVPETVAKLLFTSGSTGQPKGVINTHRMLCANLQQIAQSFPFLTDAPPVTVDWLPWNHTFGGNHNVGMMLHNGGSYYIDDGRPVPGGFDATVRNLREIAPTVYFNVPRGYEELVIHLQRDAALRETFFGRLDMLMYAGAGLPQHVWDELERLAFQTTGRRLLITTGLGCTESSPSALFANWYGGHSGLLGLPVPGLELKLVPGLDKLEARYRGPNITPGYWRQPELTRAAFDGDGFYLTGDALKFVDPARPDQGLLFDGRIAEDFKLATGTWVSVGTLRAAIVAAGAPWVQDAVIAGHDRDFVAAIVFPNRDGCRRVGAAIDAATGPASLAGDPALHARLQQLLDRLDAAGTGSANRVARALIADFAPSIDLGEVTDKGSLNQRAVLRQHADAVEQLYAASPPPAVAMPQLRG